MVRIVALLLLLGCYAGYADFVEGTHYVKLQNAENLLATPVIEIQEYFSFLCSGCYQIEEKVQKWLAIRDNVVLKKIPMVMENKRSLLHAKGYYIADAFGKGNQYINLMFKKIHIEKKTIATKGAVLNILQQVGVDNDEAIKMFDSLSLTAKINAAEATIVNNEVLTMPTFVIATKYKTDPRLAKGYDPLLLILNDIITKLQSTTSS